MSANLEKITQLRSELQNHDIDTLLILSREDSDVVLPLLLPVHVVAQTAFFFCSEGPHMVLTGRTDANMYREFGEFEVIEVEEDFGKDFIAVFNRLNPRRLALNISEHDYLSDGLTVGQYQMLIDMIGARRLAEIECSSEPIISKLRSIKSPFEVEQIRTAVQITCEIYDNVAKTMQIGMSETDIGQLFVDQMRSHGVTNALGQPYDYPLVCINRCGLAHRKPNERNILQPGDLLICDFSVSYNGYSSDIARGFYALGSGESAPPADVQGAFDTAVSAVSAVLEGIRPGMKGYEVDKLGRDVVEQAGYPTIRHAVGHQLGRQVHDGGTSLSPDRDDRPSSRGTIQAGEVYAVEPTVIQDDGLPSFIVEEDILVTEDGAEVLSTRQLELYCIRERVSS
ncbi:MAG: M24 family metallopeptidase [Spirochaetota bacterium]